MTNRDDNDDSSEQPSESKKRETPSSLGLDLDSDGNVRDDESDQSGEGDQPAGPAIGGQASDASADDDPTRNISREEVRQTLMGMPAQGKEDDDPEGPDSSDPAAGEFDDNTSGEQDESPRRSDLPSSQSLLEDSDDWGAETSDESADPAPQADASAEPDPVVEDDTQETETAEPDTEDNTRDVPVEQAQEMAESDESVDDTDEVSEQQSQQDAGESSRGTHETMMGMGAAPEANPDASESDDNTQELDERDIEEVDDFDDDFDGEKTMVSSSPFAGVDEEDDDLPEPGEQDDLPDDDFGEANLEDDEDLEEFDEYEKTMVSDDVLEGPPADAIEDSGLDVTSSPSSPATDDQSPQTDSESAAAGTSKAESQRDTGESTVSDSARQQAPPPEQQQPDAATDAPTDDQPDEPDFSSQKTEIFSSPFENDPVCPKLSVLEGPSSGQEYLLNETRNTIGRSTKNSVVVPDESMSRQHLEIVKRPDGSYRVQDLQSVNGTYLNGTGIEEADLFHGDRIQTGRTTLQFLIPGDSPTDEANRNRRVVRADAPAEAQPVDAPGRTHTGTLSEEADSGASTLNRVIVGSTIVCALLLAAIGYLWTVDTGPTPNQQQARQQFLAAIGSIQSADWKKADSQLKKARSLSPELPGLDEQLQRLKTEQDAFEALEAARTAAKNNEFETAIKKARSIPRSSIYYDEARELLRRQERAQKIDRLLAAGRKAAQNGEPIEALSNIKQVLTIAPTHPEALQIRYAIKRGNVLASRKDESDDEASDETDADEPAAVASASPTDSGGGGSRPPSTESNATGATESDSGGEESGGSDDLWLIEGSGGSGSGSESESAGSMQEGFDLYKQQKFSAAISHFESIADSGGSSSDRASSVASAISDVKSSFQKGTSAIDRKDWGTAVSSLRAALRADKKVADVGHLSDTIRSNLARAVAGQARTDLDAGNYADAYNHYKNARDYDSGHSAVRNLRQALSDKASSLYIQAANSKKTNPAKSATLCRTITSMLPPEDETYKKAKSLLNQL